MSSSPSRSPGETRRTLAVLSVASAGWAFSFGLGAPLASLWLHEAGCSAKVVGLHTSVYYLGVAAASLGVPMLMRGRGRVCVVAGMLADALTTALFPWGMCPAGWLSLRLVAGAGSALSLIPLETLVNHNAPHERRARDFGVYAFCVALGIGLGAVAGLGLYTLSPQLAFVAGGLVTLAAAGLIGWGWPSVSLTAEETSADTPLALGENLLSFGTAWVQGFLEGGMMTFLTIYLLTLGLTETSVSGLLGGLFLGVVLSQLPVAWLADRLGRLRILLACHAVLFGGLLILPVCSGSASLGLVLFLLGACCGALYPLGLVLLGDRVRSGSLAKANAWYLASNCAGSLSGPLLLGLVIDLLGRRAQFATGAATVALIVGLGLVSSRKSAARTVAANGADSMVAHPAACIE
jgi:MFS family permease